MIIRSARPKDAAAIAAVHVRTWQHTYRGHMPDAFLDDLTPALRLPFWTRLLSTTAASWATFVVEDGGSIVGFCSVGPSREPDMPDVGNPGPSEPGEVYSIYVLPEQQGKGVGRMLLDVACATLRECRFSDAILWVLVGNAPAIAFYERRGWQADGATKSQEIGGVAIEEVRYWRSLS